MSSAQSPLISKGYSYKGKTSDDWAGREAMVLLSQTPDLRELRFEKHSQGGYDIFYLPGTFRGWPATTNYNFVGICDKKGLEKEIDLHVSGPQKPNIRIIQDLQSENMFALFLA